MIEDLCDVCGNPIGDEPHDGLYYAKHGSYQHYKCAPDYEERRKFWDSQQRVTR